MPLQCNGTVQHKIKLRFALTIESLCNAARNILPIAVEPLLARSKEARTPGGTWVG